MTVDADRRTRRRGTSSKKAAAMTPEPELDSGREAGREPEPTLDLSLEPARPAAPAPAPSIAAAPSIARSSSWTAAVPAAAPMRRLPVAPGSSLSIGEIDQTVFDCPSCARPLALGTHRCPGCGTHLVRGVTLSKASIFVATGLAVGLLVGGGAGFVFGAGAGAAAAPMAAADPSSTPSVGPGAAGSQAPGGSVTPTATANDPTPTPAAPASDIPPVTRSALVQVAATNDRLAAGGTELRAVLAARPFDASAVAQVLRSISADSVFGEQLADRVAAWPASAELGAALGTFYDALHETAASGLVASVRNGTAYRAAANAMLGQLDGMAVIDAALRTVAGSAGVELPAATTP